MTCLGVIATIIGVSIIGVAILFYRAPAGYEDQDGFHRCQRHHSTRREN